MTDIGELTKLIASHPREAREATWALASAAPFVLLSGLYGARFALHGAFSSTRAERDGTSPLLGLGAKRMFYWGIKPLVRGLTWAGIGANAISWFSLLTGVFSGAALALDHAGVASLLNVLATVSDALDGQVARASGTASDAGEILDASIDRVNEFTLLSGLVIALREDIRWMILALLALLASFMVSYATAKAEALRVQAPRGAMRRSERATILSLGLFCTPLLRLFLSASSPWKDAPLLLAIALIATLGNISWIRRMIAIARAVRAQDASPKSEEKTA